VRGCESGCGGTGNDVCVLEKTGIDEVAEQLLASQEGLLSVTLTVIHYNYLTVILLIMYTAAAV
jgi:hypothetical protein